MEREQYTTLYIDFTEDELELIDEYAKYNGEDREELLQRMLKNVIEQIRGEMLYGGCK